VPDKLFLTFLDQLGLSLCPALPARVPVRFALAQGTTEEVTIPPRTQVASRDTIFETDTAFVASPSTLQAVLSVVPERDLILDHRENLIASQTAELFTEQVGQGNLQEHSFYLGDLRLFNLRAAGTIALLVNANQPDLLRSNAVRWEWWGRAETSGPAAQWQPFTVAGSGDTVLLSKAAGEIEELDIDGLKHRWIRCRITGPLRPGDSLATLVISAIAVASARADLPPDVAFANDIPLPLPVSNAQPLAPFGARPREGDTFHLAAQDVFSKTGTTVALSAENVTPMPADPPPSAVLSWEYWDGQGWQALPLLPGSTNKDFRRTGPVRVEFVIPPTMSQTRVVGQENYWIRIRIASGNFG
jgi:hypothetical protein